MKTVRHGTDRPEVLGLASRGPLLRHGPRRLGDGDILGRCLGTAASGGGTSPLERLRARRLDFDEVLAGRVTPARMSGKTVVIGYETTEEMFTVAHGLRSEQRFGYELHADGMNTLKTRRTPRFVDLTIQALTAGMFAAIGASLGVRQRNARAWKTWATGIAILAAYAGATVALAASDDVLLYGTYDIAAYAFAFALYRHLSKRWLS